MAKSLEHQLETLNRDLKILNSMSEIGKRYQTGTFSLIFSKIDQLKNKIAAREKRKNGKLIDTWHFNYTGIPADKIDEDGVAKDHSVSEIKVPIKLYLEKTFTGNDPPLSVSEVWFRVVCENPEFSFIGPDIEALRATMWGELKKHYAVKWEDYFLVSIEHRSPYEGLGTGLSFGYSTVQKGTAYDGTLLLKQYKYSRGEVIENWPGEFKDKQGRITACIPATKFNRKSMEEFAKRIDVLREKLIDLVRPENIETTLLTLSNNRLLPMPDGDS